MIVGGQGEQSQFSGLLQSPEEGVWPQVLAAVFKTGET